MQPFSLRWRLGRRSSCSLRCFVLALFLFTVMLMFFMTTMFKLQKSSNRNCKADRRSRVIKDVFHIVTAADSRQFQPLLKLIDSLAKHDSSFELRIWSLDLSACQVEYIENLETNLKIVVEQFPYHSYPLHIRQFHLVAIRPIVLEIAVMTYGEALWLNPTAVLSTGLAELTGKIGGNEGNVIVTDGTAIGINYQKYDRFLHAWVKCVKTESCIKKHVSKTNLRSNDAILKDFMSHYKLRFERFDGIQVGDKDTQSPSLIKWQDNASKLCSVHEVCILTGNHQSHGCLTPQLGQLRRNKERYSEVYGYMYIEETYGFHKHGPCSRFWNKVQAILKYLPDCKVLMWVDTDCIFTNFKISVESFLAKYPDKEILLNWPTTDRTLNAGVMIIRNTPRVGTFFYNTTTGKFWTKDWCHAGKSDQSGIADQVKAGTLRDKIVVEKNDKFLQSLCGFKNGVCKWKENDYIAHFAPPECPELHGLVKDFFDKYPQFAA